MENLNLGKTRITDTIRVSSAGIAYQETEWGVPYYQYETFIFSDNPKFRTRMFIWGTSSGHEPLEKMGKLTERAHRRIAKVMLSHKWE